jgi:glutathione peroxidase
MKNSFFDYTVKDNKSQDYNLSQHQGKVILVVNVASKCGFTPQYKGLEEVYKKFQNKNFVILGFPCNQFGAQEPGNNQEIQEFCQMNYGVSFPVLDKVDVNGPQSAPVYDFLKSKAPGILGTEMIKWNFTKFLIGKKGEVIQRYAPQTKPEEMISDIEKALAE